MPRPGTIIDSLDHVLRRLPSCRHCCLVLYCSSAFFLAPGPISTITLAISCILCQLSGTFVEFGLAIPYNACPRIWLGRRAIVFRFPGIALFFSRLTRKPSGHLVFAIVFPVPHRPVSTIPSCLLLQFVRDLERPSRWFTLPHNACPVLTR